MTSEYDYLTGLLQSGDIAGLEEAASIIEDFPDGKDDFVQGHWISNAIDVGSIASIKWMLDKGVDLDFRDDEGYTPILRAIDRSSKDRYQVLALLIEQGAPVDRKGINDWTPLHMAAAREDLPALRLLIDAGADATIKTDIDSYATALQEARMLGCLKAVAFLEKLE